MQRKNSMKINLIKYSKFWLALSGVFVTLSIASLLVFGLNLGIDFTGGSLYEWDFGTQEVDNDQIRSFFQELDLDPVIQGSDEGIRLIRTAHIDTETHQNLISSVSSEYEFTELRFESIGPVIGQELKRRSITALIILIVIIGLYIAYAFRHVSRPVSSWKYGLITIAAAAHDILITLGLFALFGTILGYQIDTAFIAALLTVMGYSINDTIVVFDRTRENLLHHSHVSGEEFESIVNESVNQTLVRSINTSITTLIVLLAVYFFGGDTVQNFVLALMIGIAAGAYSSIFMASPLLVNIQKRTK